LDQFGVQLAPDDHGDLIDVNGRLTALIRHSAERARQWYKYGLHLVPLLDRRSAACCTAMSGIYLRLRDRVAAQPCPVFDRRLSSFSWRKAQVAVWALAGLSVSGLPPSGASCGPDRALPRQPRAGPPKNCGWSTGHHLFATPRGDLTMRFRWQNPLKSKRTERT
jgi:hypothetical protein